MWYLINSEGFRIYIKPNEELTFGRKKSDILLQNDESISRLHASISIHPTEVIKANEPISTCKLKDMGSKYGTYVILGEERIEVSQSGCDLKNQDVIRFGLQNHTFTVVHVPVITVVSTLSEGDKLKLQNLMDQIDGMMSIEWTSCCTHLTVSKATLTEKVTWAMASALPIVTMNFWEQVKHAIDNGEPLPKPENFVPAISESLVNRKNVSLCPNKKRKTLFQNLIFVHFSLRQYKTFGRMISMAGGKALLYSKRPLTNKELCTSNVIVLQYPSSDTTQSTQNITREYESLHNALQENSRRMVPESEIALAILHCSVEKYCNPKYKFVEMLKRSQSKSDTSNVLALDTQDVTLHVRELPKVISVVKSHLSIKTRKHTVIPDTYDSFNTDRLSNNLDSQAQERLGSNILIDSTDVSEDSQEEEQDMFHCGTSKGKETKRDIEVIPIERSTKYIPETYDSSTPHVSQKSTLNITEKTQSSTSQNSYMQGTERLKESMMANKGTPFNEVTDITLDDGQECEVVHSNANQHKSSNIFSVEKESNKMSTVRNVRQESPEIEVINLPGTSKKHAFKEDHRNLIKIVSPTMEEDNKSPKKRSNVLCEVNNDTEFIASAKKKVCPSSDTNVMKSSQMSSSSRSESNDSFNNLTRCSSSFLRSTYNSKNFKKVYNMTPTQRITMKDMYVWDRFHV